MSNNLVAIGEILWDVFPDGPRFGGAPANFACSAAGLGRERIRVHIVSSVGDDDLGARALKSLRERNVGTDFVTVRDEPTGRVDVDLDETGSASYQFATDTAWDHVEWSDDLEQLAGRTDAVCFGTLGQRSDPSRTTIQRFVSATPSTALRILDVNLRPPFVSDSVLRESLGLANVLKLNDEELPVLGDLCGFSGATDGVLRQLAERYEFRVAALTRGPNGAVVLHGDRLYECGGAVTEVVDTVGAGDAFTAALAVGLLENRAIQNLNEVACAAAAYVCSRSGGSPAMPAIESLEVS